MGNPNGSKNHIYVFQYQFGGGMIYMIAFVFDVYMDYVQQKHSQKSHLAVQNISFILFLVYFLNIFHL